MIRDRLLQLIEKYEIDQAEIAEGTGITQATISRILSGHIKNPMIETVQALADFFNVSLDYMIGRTDDRFRFIRERNVITFIANSLRGVDLDGYRAFLESTVLVDEDKERSRQNVLAVVHKIIDVKDELDEKFPGVNLRIDWSQN